MKLFFSPPVHCYSVVVPHHSACKVVEQMIQTSFIQFELAPYDDSSDPYYLIFSRIRSLKHRIQQLITTIQNKYYEQIRPLTPEEKLITIAKMKQYIEEHKIDHLRYLDLEESSMEDILSKFNKMSDNYDHFMTLKQQLDEEIDTLRAKVSVCEDKEFQEEFVVISGVCPNKDKLMLQRLIFRKSRGHSIIMFKDRGNSTSVFLCFMNKKIYKHIGEKVYNLCKYNNMVIYDLPNMIKNLLEYEKTLLKRQKQTEHMLELSGKELTRMLHEHISGDGVSLRQHLLRVSYLQRIIDIICHSKQIGEPSNHVLFTIHLPAHETLPFLSVPLISVPLSKPRTIMPRLPCLYESNILTQLFSIPKHNQIIPSVFMLITVPFLFGMMFSDWGHGLMLLGVCVAFNFGTMFYLMAFMSIYCGVIYNEFFGMKIIRWEHLGIVQPVWAVSENGLNFQNSLKMKLSMIMAFFHMFFGMTLKIINQYKRAQYKSIIYDSIPKIGLLITTVGYLVLLIVVKWLTNYHGHESTAPSIINSVLELYLGWNASRTHSILGSMQTEKTVGSILMKINLLFIIMMIFNQTIRVRVEELYYRFRGEKRSNKRKGYESLTAHHELSEEGVDEQMSQQLQQRKVQSLENLAHIDETFYHENQHTENQLGALQVFQFVLALISSTTSYLRLFALSLAHAKLSSLILQLLLCTLSENHPYISLIRCIAFFFITIGMMLTLDVMQCLMHVVRLHWVEWMGKFYTGSGRIFRPQIEQNYE